MSSAAAETDSKPKGIRVNGKPHLLLPATSFFTNKNFFPGKNWHQSKKAFRPNAGLTSYAKRAEERKALDAVKEKEREMKSEKEAERQRRIQTIKDRRAAKEEKARYEKMAEKMHKKRVERLKRREKRNKLLNS